MATKTQATIQIPLDIADVWLLRKNQDRQGTADQCQYAGAGIDPGVVVDRHKIPNAQSVQHFVRFGL